MIECKGTLLELHREYEIKKFKKVNTKFGPAILFDIGDVDVWIPKRYHDEFTEEVIKEVNTGSSGLINEPLRGVFSSKFGSNTIICFKNQQYDILSDNWYSERSKDNEEGERRILKAAGEILRRHI